MEYKELITTMDQKDRDLLIKLSTKMDQMCKAVDKNNKENTDAHGNIIKEIKDNFKTTGKWVETIHDRIDKQIENVHDRIDDQIKDCSEKSDKINERFLLSKTFYWVVGFVIAGLLSAWASITYIGGEVKDVKKDQVIIEKAIEHYHPDYLDLH